jgi:hypothetical protein
MIENELRQRLDRLEWKLDLIGVVVSVTAGMGGLLWFFRVLASYGELTQAAFVVAWCGFWLLVASLFRK